jgi:hypothetical protein
MPKRKLNHNVQKDRLTFKVLRLIKGLTPSEATEGTELTSETGRPIANATVRNLRRPVKDGGTRYPRSTTLLRLCEAHGASIEVITKEGRKL